MNNLKKLQASGNNAILTEYENMSAGTIIQLDNPMGFIPAEIFLINKMIWWLAQ